MLPLSIGMRVALTDHIDRSPEKLLLRGRTGTVHSWIWDEHAQQPKVVYVKFDNSDNWGSGRHAGTRHLPNLPSQEGMVLGCQAQKKPLEDHPEAASTYTSICHDSPRQSRQNAPGGAVGPECGQARGRHLWHSGSQPRAQPGRRAHLKALPTLALQPRSKRRPGPLAADAPRRRSRLASPQGSALSHSSMRIVQADSSF